MGDRWLAHYARFEGMIAPAGAGLLSAAAFAPGEQVLDIGCGAGATSLQVARLVAPGGSVTGLDISAALIATCRERAREAGLANIRFVVGDAASADLGGALFDRVVSRFGVMFFDQPVAALARLRRALRAGGRCVFVCWRAPRDNPWAMAPLAAARAALGVTQPPADPLAPGPFAFADDVRLHGLLTDAGFSAIELRRFDAPVSMGASPRRAAEAALKVGPVMRFLREVGDDHAPAITEAIERALEPLAGADGQVRLAGSTWIVSARHPG